jgi:hypothetical protein
MATAVSELTCTGSLNSMYQTSYPFSIAYVVSTKESVQARGK